VAGQAIVWSAAWRCRSRSAPSRPSTATSARIALRLLGRGRRRLAEIIAAVGLAQNFGALRALATEGIQKGRMARHARAAAAAASAAPEEVEPLAEALVATGDVGVCARDLLAELPDERRPLRLTAHAALVGRRRPRRSRTTVRGRWRLRST
jgi:hypothetical protein